MRGYRLKKTLLKFTALFISLYLAVGFICSAVYVAGHICHEHSETGCAVCQQIEGCEKVLQSNFLSGGLPLIYAAFLLFYFIDTLLKKRDTKFLFTLVSLKVELMD